MSLFLQVVVMGIVATVAIDLWLVVLNKGFNLPVTNWAMVGRWVGHLPSGKLIHSPIEGSVEIKYEHALGWVFHYITGIVYAVLYLAIVLSFIEGEPTLLSAMLFGLITVAVPWFVLQPGLGLGYFARLTPKPNVIRGMSLSVHAIFGASLYIGWIFSLSLV